ncbi:MAG: hypothetical protein KAX16_07300 [Actinomycetia bacterium]|nr:hypothetical protein [Actinomycetes bacterium]
MTEVPGDQEITKLFGFPGFEAFIRVTMKYVNELREEQGNPLLTYEEFRAEIEAKAVDIINGTP